MKCKVCAEPTRNQIKALPVLRAGLDLAGEQVEFDRLPIGLEDRNDTINVWIMTQRCDRREMDSVLAGLRAVTTGPVGT